MKVTAREAQWMQSVMRTINALCFGDLNHTFNSNLPVNLEELFKQNVILELDALSNPDKTFLIESILLWLHHHRLNRPPEKPVENVIVIEEAHHLLRETASSEESLMESSLRELRSLGIGIVIVDQMPSLISRVSLANTYCTIALNVKTGQDVYALAQAMLLDREQKEILGRLPVGQAVVKLQDRYVEPFHVQIPFLDTGGKRMSHYRIPLEPVEIPSIGKDSNESIPSPPVAERISSKIITAPSRNPELETAKSGTAETPTKPEFALFLDILDHLTDSVTVRYKRLGYSARKGNHLKDKLIKAGLIRPVTFAGLNAWLRLFEITDKGKEVLNELGRQAPSHRLKKCINNQVCHGDLSQCFHLKIPPSIPFLVTIPCANCAQ